MGKDNHMLRKPLVEINCLGISEIRSTRIIWIQMLFKVIFDSFNHYYIIVRHLSKAVPTNLDTCVFLRLIDSTEVVLVVFYNWHLTLIIKMSELTSFFGHAN